METAKEQVMDAPYMMREQGVTISESQRVLKDMGTKFFEIDSKQKLLDIVSKHCGPLDEWPHVKPLLFWHGDTSAIPDNGE